MLLDLRGLGREARARARYGEAIPVRGEDCDMIVMCCGRLMVYDVELRRHFCQECARTSIAPFISSSRKDST